MPTLEEQLGVAAAKQIEEMQAESAAFSPTNEKLAEAQEKILQGFLGSLDKKNQPVHPMAGNEDFQYVMQQLAANPLVIPYIRKKLDAALITLKAAIEKSLEETLGS
jgi:hypothetical protein